MARPENMFHMFITQNEFVTPLSLLHMEASTVIHAGLSLFSHNDLLCFERIACILSERRLHVNTKKHD